MFMNFFSVPIRLLTSKMSETEIYFCGSIRAGRDDVGLYAKIVDKLSAFGKVLTPFVADKNITAEGSEHPGGDKGIHDRDVELLTQCQFVVAEVTQPSLGVGYEVGRAVAMNKKILCLYRPQDGKKLSAMIRGMDNGDDRVVRDYSEQDLDENLDEIFKKFF